MPQAVTRETLLRRSSPLSVRIVGPDGVTVQTADGRTVACTRHALAILEVFTESRTMSEALELLPGRVAGSVSFMDLTSEILLLVRTGVLTDGSSHGLTVEEGGFADPSIQVMMLADRHRTLTYLAAIKNAIRPEDIVVDLGTGSGVLSVAAARAGARQVFAIEASGIADVAQQVFDRSGVGDSITLVRGWSTSVELPVRASILLSEIIGDELLGECVLEATLDARRRFLIPTPLLIPREIALLALPMQLPPGLRERFAADPEQIEKWRSDHPPTSRLFAMPRPESRYPRDPSVHQRLLVGSR